MADAQLELRLVGPQGEPVDLWRTIVSHGVADLAPGAIDEDARIYETTLPVAGARPRTIRIAESRRGGARIDIRGPRMSKVGQERVVDTVRAMLNLEEDLAGFYEVAESDPELSWAAAGAGRMLRSPTAFEDVVKTCGVDVKLSGRGVLSPSPVPQTTACSGFADSISTLMSSSSYTC